MQSKRPAQRFFDSGCLHLDFLRFSKNFNHHNKTRSKQKAFKNIVLVAYFSLTLQLGGGNCASLNSFALSVFEIYEQVLSGQSALKLKKI